MRRTSPRGASARSSLAEIDSQKIDRNNSNPDADAKVSDLADVAAVFFHSLSAVLFIPQVALLFAPRGARRPCLANQQK